MLLNEQREQRQIGEKWHFLNQVPRSCHVLHTLYPHSHLTTRGGVHTRASLPQEAAGSLQALLVLMGDGLLHREWMQEMTNLAINPSSANHLGILQRVLFTPRLLMSTSVKCGQWCPVSRICLRMRPWPTVSAQWRAIGLGEWRSLVLGGCWTS